MSQDQGAQVSEKEIMPFTKPELANPQETEQAFLRGEWGPVVSALFDRLLFHPRPDEFHPFEKGIIYQSNYHPNFKNGEKNRQWIPEDMPQVKELIESQNLQMVISADNNSGSDSTRIRLFLLRNNYPLIGGEPGTRYLELQADSVRIDDGSPKGKMTIYVRGENYYSDSPSGESDGYWILSNRGARHDFESSNKFWVHEEAWIKDQIDIDVSKAGLGERIDGPPLPDEMEMKQGETRIYLKYPSGKARDALEIVYHQISNYVEIAVNPYRERPISPEDWRKGINELPDSHPLKKIYSTRIDGKTISQIILDIWEKNGNSFLSTVNVAPETHLSIGLMITSLEDLTRKQIDLYGRDESLRKGVKFIVSQFTSAQFLQLNMPSE